jgi:hypothetical protein
VSGIRAIRPGNVPDLSKTSFSHDAPGVNAGDFLDRTTLSRSTVFGSDDISIGTLAEFLHKLVLSVNDECRVEGSEGASFHWSRQVMMKAAVNAVGERLGMGNLLQNFTADQRTDAFSSRVAHHRSAL